MGHFETRFVNPKNWQCERSLKLTVFLQAWSQTCGYHST